MKKILISLGCALGLSTFSGCSLFLEDTYSSVTLHTVAPYSEDSTSISVETYHELVNALTHFITEGQETGLIRLTDYDREKAKADLSNAVTEVRNETALGSYALEQIHWELNSIVGSLEAELQISYDKTPEELDEIKKVTDTSGIVRHIAQSLEDMSDTVVLQNAWATSDRSQIPSFLQKAYQQSARYLVELPQVDTAFYPKEAPWRILELHFNYTLSTETREERLDALSEALRQITAPLWSQEETDHYQALLTALHSNSSYSSLGDTPFHVLVEGSGNARGFALAYLALCQEMSLSCEIVEGLYEEENHHWCIVTLENGDSHHVDPSKPQEKVYFSDGEMSAKGYSWKASQYPTAVAYTPEEPPEEE